MFRKSKKDGFGTLTINNIKIEGNWHNDQFVKGTFTKSSPSGTLCLTGDFNQKFQLHGKGTQANERGLKIEGTFKNGKPDGSMTLTYPDGRQEEALYINGKLQNRPVNLIDDEPLPAGDEIAYEVGNKQNNQERITILGKRYFSAIDDDGSSKQAIYHDENEGSSYEGELLKYNRHGKGTLYASNETYSGDFRNNEKHGEGELIKGDRTYTGRWEKNELKKGKVTVNQLVDGKLMHLYNYKGPLKDYKFDGVGTIEYPNGFKYSGGLKKDQFNGFGRWFNELNECLFVEYNQNKLTQKIGWEKNTKTISKPTIEIPTYLLKPQGDTIPF